MRALNPGSDEQVVAEPGMIDSGELPTNLVVDDGQLPSAQVD
jgi:hypothetical protein